MAIGRGLGALISATGNTRKKLTLTTGDNSSSERIWLVPLVEIKPNPKQPRRQFKEVELAELAESIKEYGILQPLLVAENVAGGYEIIAGERRWRAAKEAGLSVVPVIVKRLADQDKLEVALIENIQRENLNPVEEAFAYQRLIEEFGLTQEAVAAKVGKSRSAIANSIRLLSLPEPMRAALEQGIISPGQARALLSITDSKQREEVFASMRGEKMTVRSLEQTARQGHLEKNKIPNPNILYIEEKLRQALGTKVSVHPSGKGGTIAIRYFSQEELKEVFKKITG